MDIFSRLARRALRRPTEDALDAFMRTHAEIGMMIATLESIHSDHFYADPENIDWTDVTAANDVRRKLAGILTDLGITGEELAEARDMAAGDVAGR
jgi:hypothetical protein